MSGPPCSSLRALHADATERRARPDEPAARCSSSGRRTLSGDLRKLLSDLRAQVADEGVSVELVTVDGRVVDFGGDPRPDRPLPGRRRPPGAGNVDTGSIQGTDGRTYLYAATTLRNPNAAGPVRSIVLVQPDRSGAEALRDLTRTLPFVVILVLARRSADRLPPDPLGHRPAAPARGRRPPTFRPASSVRCPLEGPTEVRELTDRFNAMAAELVDTPGARRGCWPTSATTCARR